MKAAYNVSLETKSLTHVAVVVNVTPSDAPGIERRRVSKAARRRASRIQPNDGPYKVVSMERTQ